MEYSLLKDMGQLAERLASKWTSSGNCDLERKRSSRDGGMLRTRPGQDLVQKKEV